MKKELIEKIMSLTHPTQDIAYVGKGFLQQILEEELPDFQRIDWERLRDCFEKASNGYVSSHLHVAVKEYNSTLPTALVPLPKEMPALWHDAFTDLLHNRMQPSEFYSLIRNTYGTPQKQNLPSVEELAKEVYDRFRSVPSGDDYTVFIAQHLHDKYSLHPREWWKDAIPYSTQFKYNDTVYTFSEYSYESSTQKTWIHNTGGGKILCSHCTPYTPPTIYERLKAKGVTKEEIDELLKEKKI